MLSVKDIAARCNVSPALVYLWCNQGLPHYRMGSAGHRGGIRVKPEDLDAWLETKRAGDSPRPVIPPRRKLKHVKWNPRPL